MAQSTKDSSIVFGRTLFRRGAHERLCQHETAAGPLRLFASLRTPDMRDEGRLRRDIRPWLLDGADRKIPYEIVRCCPASLRFFGSKTFAALGFQIHGCLFDPLKETARAFDERAAELLGSTEHGDCLRHNLEMDNRIAEIRPEFRGGYTLEQAQSGVIGFGVARVGVPRELSLPHIASRLVDSGRFLRSILRIEHRDYPFFVLATFQRRRRLTVHEKAVDFGLEWMKPFRPTGRFSPKQRPTAAASVTMNPDQAHLFTGDRGR